MSHIWHTKGFQLVSIYSKLVSCEISKCLHSASKRPFFLIANRMKKWVIFDTMAHQRFPEYQISFPLFKVSEPWKFQMSWVHFALVQVKHIMVQNRQFSSLIGKEWKNESYLTQSDTKVFQNIKIICQKAVKIPNAFSISETHCPKQAVSLSHSTQNEKWVTSDTRAYSVPTTFRTSVSLCSKSMRHGNFKCHHFASVQVKHLVQARPFFSHSKLNKNESHLIQ